MHTLRKSLATLSARWLTLLVGICLAGCVQAQAQPLPYVDLSQRTPLPRAAQAEIVPLRVAVAAIMSPQGTAESYALLADYLGAKLGRPVELLHRRTYAEVNQLVADELVDLAFVCTNAYVAGHYQFGMELISVPEIHGASVYRSALIVAKDSPTRSMADLRGAVFAFTDPISFSGRTYPTSLVADLGETPERFFQRTFFTYSHDRAIQAVASGVADAAAVDSIVLDYALEREPALADQIQVIHLSQPFGIPPVVVPPNLPLRQKKQIQDLLLTMHEDAEGQQVLAALGVDRFRLPDHAAYVEVESLMRRMGELP